MLHPYIHVRAPTIFDCVPRFAFSLIRGWRKNPIKNSRKCPCCWSKTRPSVVSSEGGQVLDHSCLFGAISSSVEVTKTRKSEPCIDEGHSSSQQVKSPLIGKKVPYLILICEDKAYAARGASIFTVRDHHLERSPRWVDAYLKPIPFVPQKAQHP